MKSPKRKPRTTLCVDCEEPNAAHVRLTPVDRLPRCRECRRKLAVKILMASIKT